MRTTRFVTFSLVFLLVAAFLASGAEAGAKTSFSARLTDSDGVATKAHGRANFWLSPDGQELQFQVTLMNVGTVLAADIHLLTYYPDDPSAKPVVATLYSAESSTLATAKGSGKGPGVVIEGIITNSTVVGPLADAPAPLSALIVHIMECNAFIDVHTEQYPGGEIEGLIS